MGMFFRKKKRERAQRASQGAHPKGWGDQKWLVNFLMSGEREGVEYKNSDAALQEIACKTG